MFPSANLPGAISKANELLDGVPDTFDGVSAAASKIGVDKQFVNDFYNQYGKTMPAKAVCRLLGTTPEALKSDAERIVSGSGARSQNNTSNARSGTVTNSGGTTKKFPRLK